jgi:hypothetical protein
VPARIVDGKVNQQEEHHLVDALLHELASAAYREQHVRNRASHRLFRWIRAAAVVSVDLSEHYTDIPECSLNEPPRLPGRRSCQCSKFDGNKAKEHTVILAVAQNLVASSMDRRMSLRRSTFQKFAGQRYWPETVPSTREGSSSDCGLALATPPSSSRFVLPAVPQDFTFILFLKMCLEFL